MQKVHFLLIGLFYLVNLAQIEGTPIKVADDEIAVLISNGSEGIKLF